VARQGNSQGDDRWKNNRMDSRHPKVVKQRAMIKQLLLPIVLFVLCIGCSQAPTEEAKTENEPTATTDNSGGIATPGMGAGAATPVTGTPDLDSGGGGINQSAVKAAKNASNKAGANAAEADEASAGN